MDFQTFVEELKGYETENTVPIKLVKMMRKFILEDGEMLVDGKYKNMVIRLCIESGIDYTITNTKINHCWHNCYNPDKNKEKSCVDICNGDEVTCVHEHTDECSDVLFYKNDIIV